MWPVTARAVAGSSRSSHPVSAITSLPDVAGSGLRPPHVARVRAERPPIGWFEVHSENYFVDGGPALATLDAIRAEYPVSLHGVGLSLGSADPLDATHLARLKRLVARIEPASVSEHLCWGRVDERHVNNVYVNAVNHGFDPRAYLDAIPGNAVAEIHLAGFDASGPCLIDTHGARVAPPVWALYRATIERFGPKPTLIEWDTDLPALEVLQDEAAIAQSVLEQVDAVTA